VESEGQLEKGSSCCRNTTTNVQISLQLFWAALSYWARRCNSAVCCSTMSKNVHVAAANSWIIPSCSV